MNQDLQTLLCNSIARQVMDPQLVQAINPGGSLSVKGALEIHLDGYIARLTDAMGQVYETTWAILGDESFYNISKNYILQNPSQLYNINDYGKTFPSFLGQLELFPFIESLAEFENKFFEVFHWKNQKYLDKIPNLSSDFYVDFIDIHFHKSNFSIFDIWKDRKSLKKMESYLWDKPQFLILFKMNSQVYIQSLDIKFYELIHNLFNSNSLIQAIEKSPYKYEPQEITDLFLLLTELKIIQDIHSVQ